MSKTQFIDHLDLQFLKIPFFFPAAAFATGVGGYFLFPGISGRVVISILFGFLPLFWFARGGRYFLLALCPAFILTGYLYAKQDFIRPDHAIEHYLPVDPAGAALAGGGPQGRGDWVRVEGIVETQPEIKKKGRKKTVSFVLRSKKLIRKTASNCFSPQLELCAPSPEGNSSRSVRLAYPVYGKVQVFLFNPEKIPDYGDHVILWGSLERPKPASNPGEFDYAGYLRQREVHAILTGFGKYASTVLGQARGSGWGREIERFRNAAAERIESLFCGHERQDSYGNRSNCVNGAFIKAIILGKRKGISADYREMFMKTGTSHLLAISGLHITLFAGTLYLLCILLRQGQKVACMVAIAAVIFYVLMAGSGVPIRRSGWMAMISFLAISFERERHPLNTFCIALFFMLVVDPWLLSDLSFQLSFLSVYSLIYMIPAFYQRMPWAESFFQSFAAILGTFPVVIYHFNLFSVSGILANLGAVPLFHVSLLFSFISLLAGDVPIIGPLIIRLTEWPLEAALAWIENLSFWRWGYLYLRTPGWGQMVFYYAALLLVFYLKQNFPDKVRLRQLILAGWFAALPTFFWPRSAEAFSLTVLSAGSNEIAHVQMKPGNHWIINTGRSEPSDQAAWVISPYFRDKAVKHLAGIVLQDCSRKHAGGLPVLLRNFKFEYLLYPKEQCASLNKPLRETGKKIKKIEILQKGSIEPGGDSEMILWSTQKGKLLIKVRYQEWDILILPASDADVMSRLIEIKNDLGGMEILILPQIRPNQGQSAIDEWRNLLDELSFQLIIIPNSWWMEILEFEDSGPVILDTHREGAVTLRIETSYQSRERLFAETFKSRRRLEVSAKEPRA